MTIRLMHDMSTRNQLPFLFKERNYETGVEVGTHRGLFAEIILENWDGVLYCVDPWSIPPGYEKQAETLKRALDGGENRSDDLAATSIRLSKFKFIGRFHLIQDTSENAVRQFEKESVDWVYLDGDHRKEKVEYDLRAWWPKIKSGGVICGHDFICPGESNEDWTNEIQYAVNRFNATKELDVYLIPEEGGLPWSYVIEKP